MTELATELETGSAEELLTSVDSGVAVLTLNRPDRLNALSHGLLVELRTVLARLNEDHRVRAIVLTGAGRAFSSGADLRGGPSDAEQVVRDFYSPLIKDMLTQRCPLIGAINGVAAGAAVSLAAACDYRIAAAGASFQLSFVRVGLVPDAGATWLLPRIVGAGRAAEMAILGNKVSAETAMNWGLINQIAENPGASVEAARTVGLELASRSGSVGAVRRLLQSSWSSSLDTQLELEATTQGVMQHSDDYREARSAFVEKRQPNFGGC